MAGYARASGRPLGLVGGRGQAQSEAEVGRRSTSAGAAGADEHVPPEVQAGPGRHPASVEKEEQGEGRQKEEPSEVRRQLAEARRELARSDPQLGGARQWLKDKKEVEARLEQCCEELQGKTQRLKAQTRAAVQRGLKRLNSDQNLRPARTGQGAAGHPARNAQPNPDRARRHFGPETPRPM